MGEMEMWGKEIKANFPSVEGLVPIGQTFRKMIFILNLFLHFFADFFPISSFSVFSRSLVYLKNS